MYDVDRPQLVSVKPFTSITALSAGLIAVLALTACGTNSGDGAGASPTAGAAGSAPAASATPTGLGTPATGAVGAGDVGFATMMIPQHIQAVAMADLALKQAKSAKVKALASQVKKAAPPETARMSGWFTSVGGAVPAADAHTMSGATTMAEHGMMSVKQMADLGAATGVTFDRLWLQMMLKNHEGAMKVAKAEITDGGSPDVKQVAQAIIDRNPAQIAQMTTVLAGIPRA